MKKYQLLSAVAMGAALAGCTSDELLGDSQAGSRYSDGRISFTQKVGNTTRAGERAEAAGHYEFGVWAYKTNAANKLDTEGDIMTDYLVAYGDNVTGSTNYKALAANATTYGADAHEGTTTVAPDGISTWFYEGLGSPEGSHKEMSGAHIVPSAALQSLKYWDKSKTHHNFFAYMPYYGTDNGNGQSVTIEQPSSGNTTVETPNITFNKAGIFVTDPVVQGTTEQQPALNKAWAGSYSTATPEARAKYNDEIINANEANYAAVSRGTGDYNKDVPLNFLHINAKIKVAIWEDIPGYKVQLIDLVPTDITVGDGGEKTTAAYKDCAFTPATKAQAIEHNNKQQLSSNGTAGNPVVDPSSKPLPQYLKDATIVAKDVTGSRSVLEYSSTVAETGTSDNLRFTIASDDAVDYPCRYTTGTSPNFVHPKRISEVGGKSATVLNTTYYALPNVKQDGTTYLDNLDDDPGYSGKKLTQETGYTFHVSYRLIPEDGSAATTVYDARVWVDPKFCKWQDGKQYTYIFKITTSSNGVTDPNAIAGNIFEGSTETNPYVDPTDPRVPDNPALVPIVFDGIEVADYEDDVHTGHGTGATEDTWQISNVESWPGIDGGTDLYATRYCNYLTNAEVYTGALELSNEYYKTITAAPTFTFQGATVSDPYTFVYTNSAGAKAYFKAVTSDLANIAGNTFVDANFADVNKLSAATSVKTDAMTQWHTKMDANGKDMAKYVMYVWSQDNASMVWKYEAVPQVAKITVTPVCETETIEQTYDHKGYMKKTIYKKGIATPEYKYYKANGVHWDEINETAFDESHRTIESTGVEDTTSPAYTFSYTYSVANDGYSVGAGTEQAATTKQQAYGIAVKKP